MGTEVQSRKSKTCVCQTRSLAKSSVAGNPTDHRLAHPPWKSYMTITHGKTTTTKIRPRTEELKGFLRREKNILFDAEIPQIFLHVGSKPFPNQLHLPCDPLRVPGTGSPARFLSNTHHCGCFGSTCGTHLRARAGLRFPRVLSPYADRLLPLPLPPCLSLSETVPTRLVKTRSLFYVSRSQSLLFLLCFLS